MRLPSGLEVLSRSLDHQRKAIVSGNIVVVSFDLLDVQNKHRQWTSYFLER